VDIKGKIANMPVYQLWVVNVAKAPWSIATPMACDPQEVLENVIKYQKRVVRWPCAVKWVATAVVSKTSPNKTVSLAKMHHKRRIVCNRWTTSNSTFPGAYYQPDVYARSIPVMFDYIRGKIGYDLFLLHDIHERIAPIDAVRMGKALEPYRLFFLEDPFAPDQIEWFRRLREHCTTPLRWVSCM
jgi:mannonate dehydratase